MAIRPACAVDPWCELEIDVFANDITSHSHKHLPPPPHIRSGFQVSIWVSFAIATSRRGSPYPCGIVLNLRCPQQNPLWQRRGVSGRGGHPSVQVDQSYHRLRTVKSYTEPGRSRETGGMAVQYAVRASQVIMVSEVG